MKSLLIWIMTALVFTAAGGLSVYYYYHVTEPHNDSAGPDEDHPTTTSAPAEEAELSHDEHGNIVVTVDKENQERLGIEIQPLAAQSHQPELTAFGTLQEDPARSFTLRAPWPGILRLIGGNPWPVLGAAVAENIQVGVVEPRLGPVDQADLSARLATAHADVEQARASLEAMNTSLESKRQLNSQGKIVSDQAVQEAAAQLKGEEARLHGAQETVRILESFMSTATRPSEAIPLTVSQGGQVLEVLAQPGEAVESGQALVKIGQFDRMLARVSLAAGESAGPDVVQARLLVPGHESTPLEARRISMASTADTVTGGQAILFSVQAADFPLQPGLSVVARLQLPGAAREGVVIPRSAVVRVSGQGWVYLRSEEEKFTRRLVPLTVSVPQGWFVADSFNAGEEVVVQGAQAILSKELKFGIEEEEE